MRCCMSATVMVLLFWSESEFCSDWGSSLYGFPCRSGVLYGIGIGSGCSRAVPWEPAHQQSLQSLGNTCSFLDVAVMDHAPFCTHVQALLQQ